MNMLLIIVRCFLKYMMRDNRECKSEKNVKFLIPTISPLNILLIILYIK